MKYFILVFMGLLVIGSNAYGYQRTMSCSSISFPFCEPGDEPVPIYWPTSCLTYYIEDSLLSTVPDDQVIAAIRSSFETWSEVDCSFVKLTYGGLKPFNIIGFDQGDYSANENIVMFREDRWSDRADIIALTSVTFDKNSGLIYDSDVEFNGVHFEFGVLSGPSNTHADIENTLTHEAGHFLGLDHSNDRTATMYAQAETGEMGKRILQQDDINGLCAIYPATSPVACRDWPADTGGNDPGGCALVRHGRPGVLPLFLIIFFGALFIVSSRKKRNLYPDSER